MKIIGSVFTAVAWICVGTVALEGGVAATAWVNGKLSFTKLNDIVAVAYGVDDASIQEEIERTRKPDDAEQLSYDEVLTRRWLMRMDLDLREMAVDKALNEGVYLSQQLDDEHEQYRNLRKMFEDASKNLAGAAQDDNLLEVARTLVSLPPKQAKDEILRWMKDDKMSQDQRVMNDLVTIIKSMPLDKRKKILVEFKSAEEEQKLGDVLQKIRLGVPSVDLIRRTRQQLHQFDSQFKPGDDKSDISA